MWNEDRANRKKQNSEAPSQTRKKQERETCVGAMVEAKNRSQKSLINRERDFWCAVAVKVGGMREDKKTGAEPNKQTMHEESQI